MDDMIAKGWSVRICDTPVPFFDVKVRCGRPTDVGHVGMHTAMVPGDFAKGMAFVIMAEGDSMVDAGIEEGDELWVETCREVYDGEIVVASVGGEYTIKAYCEDDEGRPWLVPCNKAYDAFQLDADSDMRVLGKVVNVVKRVRNVPTRVCRSDIRKVKKQMREAKKREFTKEELRDIIRNVEGMVQIARQWFAVFNAMEKASAFDEGDYGGFVEMVRETVPGHEFLPKCGKEISCMAVDSFKKDVDEWREDYAPVKGKRFQDYKNIAKKTKDLLK